MSNFVYKNLSFEHKHSDTPNNIDFPKHMHNEWEIYFFLSGDANYIVGENMYNLENNDLILIKPAVFHRVKLNSKSSYTRFVIDFPESLINKDLLKKVSDLTTKFHVEKDSFIESIFFGIKNLLDKSSKSESIIAISRAIELVLLNLLQYDKQSEISNNLFSDTFSKIIRFIDVNISSDISIDIISKKFFVSNSWISHSFKKNLGISCTKYINMKRILHAQKLIKSGMPPTEVANVCSYNEYSTFFRQYKQFLHTTPESDKN